MARIHGFNTGRIYQADGQRISWTVAQDGVVLFNDHSRGISGALPTLAEDAAPWLRPTESSVLAAYDRGDYRWDRRADAVKAKAWPSNDSRRTQAVLTGYGA